jgi:drug/metabolite transporter (DMT)-like permease
MRRRGLTATTVLLFIVGMAILAFADFSIKETAGKITPSLGTLIYALLAILPPLLWTLWTRAHEPLVITQNGVLWAAATGLAFGIFTGLMFLLFSQGVDLSIGTPVVRMGGIVVAATLGVLIFREGLNWQYIIGFLLAAIGIYLVATR